MLYLGSFFLCGLVSRDGQESIVEKDTGDSIWFNDNSRHFIETACLDHHFVQHYDADIGFLASWIGKVKVGARTEKRPPTLVKAW